MKKTLIRSGIVVLVLAGIGFASYTPVARWWQKRNLPSWREATVSRGEIVSVVNSTGTIRPVMSVQIGAFVSGPIDPTTPLVEFNQEVKAGDVLAVIDQRLYEAEVGRDQAGVEAAQAAEAAARASVEAAEASVVAARATLRTRLAEVERAKAQFKQAENDEARARALAAQNKDFISQAEMDQFVYNRLQLAEQVNVARARIDEANAAILQAQAAVSGAKASRAQSTAAIAQAQANKTRSDLNMGYTVIKSPFDGIVIDRKIEPGQTLAATFQTPELFVVAPRMREEMHVYAAVDEADIGLIRDAQRLGNIVHFTVDAYPEDLFKGTIKEVRFSSTTTQNVVTYTVIVSSPNPDLKLLPGMTASISFQIIAKQDVLKIPNAALRFYPKEEHVRKEDRKILDGADSLDDDNETNRQRSATEKATSSRERKQRHVWVVDGDYLKAVAVVTGISDSRFTEAVSGDITAEMKLVTGIKKKKNR